MSTSRRKSRIVPPDKSARPTVPAIPDVPGKGDPPLKPRRSSVAPTADDNVQPVTIGPALWPGNDRSVEISPDIAVANMLGGRGPADSAAQKQVDKLSEMVRDLTRQLEDAQRGMPSVTPQGGLAENFCRTDELVDLDKELNEAESRTVADPQQGKAAPNDTYQELVKKNAFLMNLTEDEKKAREKLQFLYQKHLERLRREAAVRIGRAKSELLKEVEVIVQKFSELATQAVTSARRAHVNSDKKREEVQMVANEACRRFEEESKKKMSDILEGYKHLADQAALKAHTETNVLRERCHELQEKVAMLEKQQRPPPAPNNNAEVEELRREINRLEAKPHHLSEDVEKEIEKFERIIISECLEILWKHNVPITEGDLRRRLNLVLNKQTTNCY